MTQELQAKTTDYSGPDPLEALAAREWQNLLEKDDRTSPEEYPDMCLINRADLGAIICEGYLLAKDQDLQRIDALRAEVEALRGALRAMVDDYCDYMLINCLGNPESQHIIKRARTALGDTQ